MPNVDSEMSVRPTPRLNKTAHVVVGENID
jgi:hypothetical protein